MPSLHQAVIVHIGVAIERDVRLTPVGHDKKRNTHQESLPACRPGNVLACAAAQRLEFETRTGEAAPRINDWAVQYLASKVLSKNGLWRWCDARCYRDSAWHSRSGLYAS